MVKILAILYSGGKFASEQPKLLGTTENKLGIENWCKEQGHEFIVSDSKDGPDSDFQKHIKDAEILITTPFHPAYLTKEILATAKNLKCAITAGVGSDHVDLNACNEKKIGVYEVSGSNVVSVAEHVVMTILLLVRNYNVGHEQISQGKDGGWNVAAVARDAYDVEGKTISTIGIGRIGTRVLQRMAPFNPKELLYYDYAALSPEAEKKLNARRVEDLKELLGQTDILTVNCPLHEGTKDLLNEETIGWLKPGAWVVNTARGAIVNAEAMAAALKSGHVRGYGGDVWNHQPAPKDHPWRNMSNTQGGGNGMVPHYSGTTLDAQLRYSTGAKEILENYLSKKPQDPVNVIVEDGEYASKAYGQRKQTPKVA